MSDGKLKAFAKNFFNNFTLARFLPFLGFHHVIMVISVIAILLNAFLLAGCNPISTDLHNLYLLSVRSPNATYVDQAGTSTTPLVVRAGYFGICAQAVGASGWHCASDAFDLEVRYGIGRNGSGGAIELASHFTHHVVFPGLLIAGMAMSAIAVVLMATFPGWQEDVDARTGEVIDIKPFPSRPVSQIALALLCISAFLFLITALWQHIAAAAALSVSKAITADQFGGAVGAAAMALCWAGFAVQSIAAIMLLALVFSIRLLDKLTDEDSD